MRRIRNTFTYLSLVAISALVLSASLLILGGTGAVAANSDWTEVNVPGATNILDIEAVDINTAWAVGTIPGGGGIILKTTDGGATWNVQKTLTASWPAQALSSVSVVDANTAWASGYRTLLKTTDGGANWDVVYYATSMYEGVPDVYALDADNAWAILIDATLTSYIFKTSDGGATWVKLYTRPYSSGIIGRISAVDNTTAWAVGGGLLSGPSSSGTIIKTSDMGATWLDQTPVGSPTIFNVLARDANTAWVTGNGTVMRTIDGGASWATMYTMAGTELWGIAASDASTVWVAGKASSSATGGCVVKTVDEGSTWQTLYSTSSYGLYCVSALDAVNAWAGGQNNTGSNSIILHTVNGGDARPDIAEMAPFSGQAGDTVIITGCDFGADRGSSIVSFGGSEAASYILWSNGEIRVTVPAGLSGSCKVTVTTAVGTSNASSFMVTYPVSLTSIEPASGLQFTLSLETRLTGSSFQPGATVRFVKDAHVLDAYNVNVASVNELTCNVGLFGVQPGIYDVIVTNPDGGVATLTGAFTVNAACGSGAGTAAVALGCTLGLLSLGHNLNRRRRRH